MKRSLLHNLIDCVSRASRDAAVVSRSLLFLAAFVFFSFVSSEKSFAGLIIVPETSSLHASMSDSSESDAVDFQARQEQEHARRLLAEARKNQSDRESALHQNGNGNNAGTSSSSSGGSNQSNNTAATACISISFDLTHCGRVVEAQSPLYISPSLSVPLGPPRKA